MEEGCRREKGLKKLPIFLMFGLVLFFVVGAIYSKYASAATAPAIITYQGKLLISSRLATTTQNMYFVLYDASTAGNVLYTASGTIGTPQAVSTTPSQGLFSINLGDTGTNPLSQAIFQNNGSVYLEVRVGADTLTPRKQITAAPYALNSRYLDGVGVNTNSTTEYIPKSDTSGNFTFNSTTISTSTISRLTVSSATSTNLNVSSLTNLANTTITNATSTNLYISSLTNLGGALTFTTANGTSITSTNAFFATLAATTFSPTNISTSNVTTTNLNVSGLTVLGNTTISNVTSTNLSVSGISGLATITFTSATGTNANFSGLLSFGNLNGTSITSTNIYISGVSSFGNTTFTNVTTTNLNVSSLANILKLGINSSSPIAQLAVQGTGTANPFSVNSSTGASLLTVLTNGNVGIGSSTPLGSLVIGSGQILVPDGTVDAPSVAFINGANYGIYKNASSVGIAAAGSLVASFTAAGVTVAGLGIQNSTNAETGGFAMTTGQIAWGSSPTMDLGLRRGATGTLFVGTGAVGSFAGNVVANKIGIGTSTLLAKLMIQGSGAENPFSIVSSTADASSMLTVLTNGNVGIGTSAPVSTFAVVGTTTITGGVLVGNGTATFPTYSFINDPDSGLYSAGDNTVLLVVGTQNSVQFGIGGFTTGGGGTAALPAITFGGDSNTGFWAPAAEQLAVATNGVNRLTVSTTAFAFNPANLPGFNVGIGTTTPIATFAIQGNTSSNPFEVASSTGASIFRILQNGFVGINSSSPSSLLALGDQAGLRQLTFQPTTGAIMGFGVASDGSAIGVFEGTTRAMVLRTYGMDMASNGYIQWSNGVNNPLTTMDLSLTRGSAGTLYVGGVAGVGMGGNLVATKIGIGTTTLPALLSISLATSAPSFDISSSSGSSMMRVLANGNVGIGTSTPTQKLSVVGNISNIIDSGTTISLIATTSVGITPLSVFVSGRYAYTANWSESNITIVDVSNPSAPLQISSTTVGTNPQGIYVSGRYAYVSNQGSDNFSVVDVSNPKTPIQVATVNVGDAPVSVYVSGRYAYVTNAGSKTLSIIDISNPLNPIQIATTSVGTLPQSVYVSGRYAYVANSTSNTISVVDISNPSAPIQIATTSVGTAPKSIYVSGRYAYVANRTAGTISIVDISNPAAPIQVSTTSVGSSPQSIYVSGRYAYVANNGSGSNSISIVDVSNPLAPRQVVTTSAGTNPASIYVSGRYAYVTSETDSTISVFDISGTEVTSLIAHSAEVGNLQSRNDIFAQGNIIAGTGLMVGAGGIMSNGSLTVFASSTGATSSIFDISSAQTPNIFKVFANGNVGIGTSTPASRLTIQGSGTANPFSVVSSTAAGTSMFTILTNGNVGINSSTPSSKLVVVGNSYFSQTSTFGGNISNIIDSNTVISQIATTPVGYGPYSIFVSGRYAYVANNTSNTISVVDVSNPSFPRQIATTSVGTGPYSIYVSGRYAYTANDTAGTISVVDVSNPSFPRQVATTPVGSGPQSIYVSGRYAYTANINDDNISVVDISNPLAPRQIATATVGDAPISVYVSGRYAYVANATAGTISVVDISNPSAPVQVAATSVGTYPVSIFVSGRYAYVANQTSNTISIVDISNPSAPSQVATTSVGTSPASIFVSGRYAYVANEGSDSVSIVDVSSSTAPSLVATVGVGSFSRSVYVSGRYAYVANRIGNTISIVDISGTEVSSLMAHSAEVGNIQSRNDIFAQGNIIAGTGLMVGAGGIMSNGSLTVFASSTGATSSIFDISSAQTPDIFKVFANGNIGIGTSTATARFTIVSTTAPGTSMFTILTNGNIGIATSTPAEKLSVVGNISNIIDPNTTIVRVGNVAVGSGVESIFASGRYVYTANFNDNNITIVDVSNPSNPIVISSSTAGTNPRSIFVSGRYAYTANGGSNNISIIDISNPIAPFQVSTANVGSLPQAIYVSGRYAYVANYSSKSISVVDVSNPYAPVQIATTSVGNGARSIYVSGRYAYVANYASNTISVVDISNPSAPFQVSTTSVGTSPKSIYVSGRYAYTANENGSTGLSIIDISNPAVPVQVATLDTGGSPVSIYVSGRYAYIADEGDSTLVIVDVASSTNPKLLKTLTGISNAISVYISGRYAYVANSGPEAISVIDISGTEVSSLIAHSAEVGNLQSRNDIFAQGNIIAGTGLMVGAGGIMSNGSLTVFASSTGATSSIFDISSAQTPNIFKVFANGNVGIGTSTPSQKLSVVGNISNITSAGTAISQIASTSVGKTPEAVFVSGRYAYTANSASNTISIVDVSNPSAPVQIATTSVGTTPNSIYVAGRYLYVSNQDSNNISIVDISNPSKPLQISTASVGVDPRGIYVAGRYAYVTNFTNDSISVVDISNPSAPTQVATTSVGDGPRGIYVSGRYAYVANYNDNTISMVDISNPTRPNSIQTVTVGKNPRSVVVSGRYAYVSNFSSNTISVVDLTGDPLQVATTSVEGGPYSIFISGRYAYVPNATSNTISVVDISNPLAPRQVVTTSVSINPSSVYVSGRYAYVTSLTSSTLVVVDISGTEVTSLMAHSAEVGNLQSRNDIFAQGNIIAGTSLAVGAGGIISDGSLSVSASSSVSYATSSIFGILAVNLQSPAAATFALCHSTNGAVNSQVIYDCNGTVTADYMEMYAADVGLQKGDVVALSNTFVTTSDGNRIPKLSKSISGYQSGLVGVISDADQAGDFNSIGYNVADEDNPLPLALSGRVPIKVTDINGDIHVGDKLTSSNIPGVAMKATDEGPTIAIAMGDYTSSEIGTVMSFVNISWNNKIYRGLTVDTNSSTITIGTSVSPYDLVVTGNISMSGASMINKLSFATSTLFESSVGSFAGARAFIFNAPNFSDTSADNYLISLRSNNIPVFSVAANGDVHAKGNYYGASAVLGTSTNPGDLAERVDIAIDDTVEAGDVMVVDQNAPDTYRRSGSAYEQSVAGIISTNPTIVVGNGKTDYTAVMAMVGRVPVKVSNSNGNIQRGDLLISASTTGFAMKYDPTKDGNNKMVAVIGVALEPLNTSTGKILTLIRTGWVYNRDQAIAKTQNDISQLAIAQGIDLSSSSEPGNLNITNTNGQLSYTGGNLDLQNNSIINVASIQGKDDKWRIDQWGNLIQKITTAIGDKEIYGLQSSGKQEIIISGTSTLENGTRKIILTDLDQAIIDKTVPLKIQITPSGETKGVYVSERNYDSFVVKENENGQSNSSFDWTVIAKLSSLDEMVGTSGTEQNNPPSGGQAEPPILPGVPTTTITSIGTSTDPGLILPVSVTTTVAEEVVIASSSPDTP